MSSLRVTALAAVNTRRQIDCYLWEPEITLAGCHGVVARLQKSRCVRALQEPLASPSPPWAPTSRAPLLIEDQIAYDRDADSAISHIATNISGVSAI